MITCTLKELVERKGVTIYWLMKQTSISKKSIYDLSNMKTKAVHLETIDKICLALDCTPNDILKVSKD